MRSPHKWSQKCALIPMAKLHTALIMYNINIANNVNIVTQSAIEYDVVVAYIT